MQVTKGDNSQVGVSQALGVTVEAEARVPGKPGVWSKFQVSKKYIEKNPSRRNQKKKKKRWRKKRRVGIKHSCVSLAAQLKSPATTEEHILRHFLTFNQNEVLLDTMFKISLLTSSYIFIGHC